MATPNTCVAENLAEVPPENKLDGGAELSKSVNELADLSIAIQNFKSKYDELQKHLEFIEQAIDAKTKEFEVAGVALGSSAMQNVCAAIDNGSVKSNGDNGVSVKSDGDVKSDSSPKPKEKPEGEEEEEEEKETELVLLCKSMNSRDLRKFIVTHISKTTILRDKIPVALKSAPKPSKLVFDSIGRFYLQGSKAYTKDSPMIRGRLASVLSLEFYLLSGCVESEAEMDPSLKEEAASAAISWRKRLIVEGGVANACEIDAKGLILFIGCFGIPGVFKNEDISNLVRLSNPREFSHALRQSQVLPRRVSDIAEGMMKKGMVVEALDLAYTFGFEEKFSPKTTLNSFLQKSEEAWKKAKEEARDLSSMLKEANKNYLAALKSVVNCLYGHKIDFVKFLPRWQLKDTIIMLEKDIKAANKKVGELVPKRKVEKNNSSNKVTIPEAKRTRFTEAKQTRFGMKDPSVASPSVVTLHEQRIASHMDGYSPYDGSLAAHLPDARSYGYPNNYPTASSAQIGFVSRSLSESYLGSTVTSGGNMLGGAVAGPAMSPGIGIPTGSYSGYQGDMIKDNVGTMLNSNTHPYRWHGMGEGALSNDRSVGQSFVGQPSSARVSNLYGKTSTEGFTGLQDHLSIGVASRSAGSDLYGFADAVFDT
ncbi:protein FRIGIDA [Gastrolobium bilobum]|uniref:protein FRIGIDA n=1 Tax=Gastrolobium bilobum TaxID=150636 RepID=UPI002AB2BE1F|nr:protein FRIGIDA [Gastrolobium bilobum]